MKNHIKINPIKNSVFLPKFLITTIAKTENPKLVTKDKNLRFRRRLSVLKKKDRA